MLEIEKFRAAWCAETSYWPNAWTPECPSIGQCAVTAEAFRRLHGGSIIKGRAGADRHYWNEIDGVHIDLTRNQFNNTVPIIIESRLKAVPSSPNFDRRLALLLQRMGQ